MCIQSWFRGCILRGYIVHLHSSASTIQKNYKGHLGREDYRRRLRVRRGVGMRCGQRWGMGGGVGPGGGVTLVWEIFIFCFSCSNVWTTGELDTIVEWPPGYVYVCMYVCTSMYMHVCMYVHVHACMYVRPCTCMYVCTSMYMHVCMYVHVHACMYVRPCTCMYMHVPHRSSPSGEGTMFVSTYSTIVHIRSIWKALSSSMRSCGIVPRRSGSRFSRTE